MIAKICGRAADSKEPMFLLANKKGCFALLGRAAFSRFQGCHFTDGAEHYKAIEDIQLVGCEPEQMEGSLHSIERRYSHGTQRFWLNHGNIMLCEFDGLQGHADVLFDCRRIYDYSDMGRIYSAKEEQGCILVEYTKYKDPGLSETDYRLFLAIAGAESHALLNEWEERSYSYDCSRGSRPWQLFVNRLLRLKIGGSGKLAISFATERERALQDCRSGLENFDVIKRNQEKFVKSLIQTELRMPEDVMLAYQCCTSAMDSFIVKLGKGPGIYAGLPGFHQVWTRDEAICLKALMIEGRYGQAKSILFRQLAQLLPDGRIANRFPASELGSADGVGWVFKRLGDLIQMLDEKGRLEEFFSRDELCFAQERLAQSIQRMLECYGKRGLIENRPLETWMDTSAGDDTRQGARIEIQALTLAMYRLMIRLCRMLKNEPKFFTYNRLEFEAHRHVRQVFWKRPILYDGEDDVTIRPNVFMAYYVYPGLLSKGDWVHCFDRALGELWLDWGGIASISKEHPLFTGSYSGEDNRSYHRGDSWFFLNSMAALCMHRLNRKRYRGHIEQILKASTHEILNMGILGYHAELSSAQGLTSSGNLAQAWSSALYIELVNELSL